MFISNVLPFEIFYIVTKYLGKNKRVLYSIIWHHEYAEYYHAGSCCFRCWKWIITTFNTKKVKGYGFRGYDWLSRLESDHYVCSDRCFLLETEDNQFSELLNSEKKWRISINSEERGDIREIGDEIADDILIPRINTPEYEMIVSFVNIYL